MYTVMLDDELLFDPRIDDLEILNPVLSLEDNATGGFDFEMPPTHPLYNAIEKHKSRIEVYQDDSLLFRGRILDDEDNFYNVKSVICEGVLSFFNDSVLPPYSFEGGVREYVELLVSMHNDRMGEYEHKKFVVGKVTVTDPNDYIVRGNRNYPTTWDEMKDKLLDILGGHFVLRIEGETQYLDYLADSEYMSGQSIEFGENLLDIKRFTKGEDVATAIIPLGERIESEDGEEEEEGRLTIESVNDGRDYVYDEDAVKIYGGYIFKTVDYPDVTVPQNLMNRGYQELAQAVLLGLTIELTAIDMSMLDIDIDDFRVFEYVEVNSEPHDLSALFLVQQMTIHLTEPSQNTLTVGKNFTELTTTQTTTERNVNKAREEIQEVNNINRQVTERIEDDLGEVKERTDNYWQVNNDDGGTPNMVAGNKNNFIPSIHKGSKIAGGGSDDYSHELYADYGTISGGEGHLLTNPYGTIGGGNSHSLHGDGATVAGGDTNGAYADYGFVGGGKENNVYDVGSVVSGGQENNVTSAHSAILGGHQNRINSEFASILGGDNNEVNGTSGAIISGKENEVNADYGLVTNGENNQANSPHSTVINGVENQANSPTTFIGNGKNNATNSNYATILNGERNVASSYFTTVLNGENNRAYHDYAGVLVGRNNMATGQASVVLGGQDNTVHGHNSSAIGKDALANTDGSFAHAHGNFGDESRAQTQRIKLIRVTNSSAKETLGVDNSSDSIPLQGGSYAVYSLEYLIMAQSSNGETKIWKLETIIGDVGNGVTTIKAPEKEIVYESESTGSWDVAISIGDMDSWDIADVYLEIEGSTSETYWMADLTLTELVTPVTYN